MKPRQEQILGASDGAPVTVDFHDAEAPPTGQAHPAVHVTTGSRLGGYEIIEQLAQGGMGQIFKALDVALQRFVALKVVIRTAHEPDEAERLRRAAEAVAGLQHPHIIPILERGEEEDFQYFTMPLLEG